MNTLTPCYGRDYKNKAQVEADFRAGKDFEGDMTMGFKPCSIADFKTGTAVKLRYARLTKCCVVIV